MLTCKRFFNNTFFKTNTGQNKNRYALAYLYWQVKMGRHEEFEHSMQLYGHTRQIQSYAVVINGAWKWWKWSDFLSCLFHAVKEIRKFHHFRVTVNELVLSFPGTTFCLKLIKPKNLFWFETSFKSVLQIDKKLYKTESKPYLVFDQ